MIARSQLQFFGADRLHKTDFHLGQVVENLTSVERELLSEHLLKLRHALDPGFTYLNWTSLGILDFVAAATKVRPCSALHCSRYMVRNCN